MHAFFLEFTSTSPGTHVSRRRGGAAGDFEDAEKTRLTIIEAARNVFYCRGVGRSTLKQIAQEAGVTRGAIYGHFKNKTDLFFAMREDVLESMKAPLDDVLFSDEFTDPLDRVAAGLKLLFRILDDSEKVRRTFEIMMTKCEHVDEFAGVQDEVVRPSLEFLAKIERIYQDAAGVKKLNEKLTPHAAAHDTWVFIDGLLHLKVGTTASSRLRGQIPGMVDFRVGLRRAS